MSAAEESAVERQSDAGQSEAITRNVKVVFIDRSEMLFSLAESNDIGADYYDHGAVKFVIREKGKTYRAPWSSILFVVDEPVGDRA